MENLSLNNITDKFGQMVYNICLRFINDNEEAKDLTQEVFIEVYRSLHKFRDESGLSTWIYRISVNKCLDELKSRKRQKRLLYIKSIFANDTHDIDKIHDHITPETIIEEEDRWKIINKALDSIPERQRTAITLYRIESMTLTEIAEIMKLNKSAVEMLIYRAKSNLKKILYRHYEKLF